MHATQKKFIKFLCINIMKNTQKVHARPKIQMHMDKKNTKLWETKIHSQGHKTLMYGTKVHVKPKVQIHRDKKKHQILRS